MEVTVPTFSIPLKVASTGLSLTLLLLTACVAFSLTTMAGQQSTDRATNNGRRALDLAYASSENNTVELSDTIRSSIIDRVVESLQKEIASMEHRLKVAEDIFYGFNGTWGEFDARYLTMFRLMVGADGSYEDMRFQVFTAQGFFLNILHKTDDRADDVRNDGVVGSVAETNEGWRYGVNSMIPQMVSREPVFQNSVAPFKSNASRMLAGNIGDPLAATAAMPSGHTTWMPAKLTFPLIFHADHPMAAYRPLLSLDGRQAGTIEVYQQLPLFVKGALGAIVIHGRTLQNMSVVLVDTDKAILGAHNVGTESSKVEGLAFVGVLAPMHGLYNAYEHPSIRVTSLANYLDTADGWTDNAGLFDQMDHFREQPFVTLARVTASGGRVVDTGVHNWDVEMRDGACGVCTVFDSKLQKEVLLFDGATTLYLYRNMTRRSPIIAQSQVSGPGEPWRSKYEAFNDRLVHADGSECVAHMWHETADEAKKHCLVRPDISVGPEFMVSMRIRPDVAYTETSPTATTPRLFSDTLVGDSNIRLFANGQLYLFVLRYGCRTKPYKDGFPVGAWTTVTAVVGGGRCRVFVNGTEYSTGHDGRKPLALQSDWSDPVERYDVRLHANPYRSGQHFKGRMDSLQLFSHSMSDKEVQSLHTDDKLVRDVGRVQYFTQTNTLDMNGETRAGAKWSVAVMVPREDIMRVVDANRRETLEDVQVEEDNTMKELAQRANTTVMVIVAIATTSVLVFLVFNHMMTQSVERFAHEILRVSQAEVEGIDTLDGGTSLLLEVNVMRGAMKTLVENMREYKTFMPEAIFTDEQPVHEVLNAPGMASGHAAVIFTDIQGSTWLWEACTEAMAEALRLHNTVIREVIAEHAGYEVKTIGDAFMVAFDDLDAAVQFGLCTQERLFQATWPAGLLEVLQAPWDMKRGLHGLRLRMGVTHGAVSVERSNAVRRCDYFGPTVNRAARLEANGMCGGVTVEARVVAGIAAVQQQHAVVVPLGDHHLKGIGEVPLCLLVPASMPQRVAHVTQEQAAARRSNIAQPNAFLKDGSDSSSNAGSDDSHTERAQRAKLQAVGRFGKQLTEVRSATTGHVDYEVGTVPAAAVTTLADGNLGHVVACLGRSDGRLLNVCGTAALVAWNVMAPCAGHTEAALRFASLVVRKGGMHCGITSGKVFSGYVHAGRQRFVTAVGHSVQVCQRLYVMSLQQDQAVLFAAQDTHLTDTMQAYGLAATAGQLISAGATYTFCAVLCDVVRARLQSKQGLLSREDPFRNSLLAPPT